MSIFSLRQCADKESSSVGKKAYWLGQMIKENEKVPFGICISVECFFEYLSQLPEYDEIVNFLEQIKENKIFGRRNLSKVRQLMSQGNVSQKLTDEILKSFSENGIMLSEGVAVRSSSVNEDNYNMVFAGVYTSYVDISNISDLKKAIVGVWSSQFSEASLFYDTDCSGDGMAVIIQQMKHGTMHGVMFTKSPNDSEYMLIEAATTVNGIVDGQNPVSSIYISRESHIAKTNSFNESTAMFHHIATVGFRLEEKFNMFCDIEWAYWDGVVYLLQCRPLSNTISSNFNHMVFSQDDMDMCSRIYLGSCQWMYQRYLGKQYIFRQGVIRSGYSVYRQYYTIIKPGFIDNSIISQIEECFSGAHFVILEFSKQLPSVMCSLSDIREKLCDYEKQTCSPYIYCRIGEIIVADLSGYCSITDKGDVFVEYVVGRLTSLIHGFNLPAQLVIHQKIPQYSSRPSAEFIDSIDLVTGKNTRFPYGKQIPELTHKQILELLDFTEKLSCDFPNSRLEWYYSNGKLYGKDLSIEENQLTIHTGVNFISSGQCEGTVYHIENLEFLDDVAQKYDISLYQHSKKENHIYGEKRLTEIIEKIKFLGDAIVFAERPSIGLLCLASYTKGMVFKKGAVLSHVGIFLREHKIPAVISAEYYGCFKNGEKIKILNDASVVLEDSR